MFEIKKCCDYCGEKIEEGQVIVKDNYGDLFHIDCDCALSDGYDIDMERGDN